MYFTIPTDTRTVLYRTVHYYTFFACDFVDMLQWAITVPVGIGNYSYLLRYAKYLNVEFILLRFVIFCDISLLAVCLR